MQPTRVAHCPACAAPLTTRQVAALMREAYPPRKRRYKPRGRPRGRPAIPRHCAVCGEECRSAAEAKGHCRT